MKLTSSVLQIKAVNKFKGLVNRSEQPAPMFSILGEDQDSHFVQPPLLMDEEDLDSPRPINPHRNHSLDIYDRDNKARDLVVGGAHGSGDFQRRRAEKEETTENTESSTGTNPESKMLSENEQSQSKQKVYGETPNVATSKSPSPSLTSRADTPTKTSISEGTRGHARDPLEEEHLYLFIGASTYSAPPTCPTSRTASLKQDDGATLEIDTSGGILFPGSETPIDMSAIPIVSESPGATDIDIYETAYAEEIERIQSNSRDSSRPEPTMYLTRRMEKNQSRLHDIMRSVREAEAKERDTKPPINESELQTQEQSSTAPEPTTSSDAETPATKPTGGQPSASQPAPTVERKNSTSVSSSSTEASRSAARRSISGLRGLVGRLRGKGLGNPRDGGDGKE